MFAPISSLAWWVVFFVVCASACEPTPGPTPQCAVNEDCPDGDVCSDGRCDTPAPSGCESTCECAVGEVCADGLCAPPPPVPCAVDGDCPRAAGERCEPQRCDPRRGICAANVPTACVVDGDCLNGLGCGLGNCLCAAGFCLSANDCESDANCSFGARCVEQRCALCAEDTDCDVGERCIDGACLVFEGCLSKCECAPGEVCTDGACVAAGDTCASSADCPRGTDDCEALQCNGFSNVCFDPSPADGCSAAVACPPDRVCVDGDCRLLEGASCVVGSDCAGDACVEGRCT